jgi:putative serine protease PepD
MGDNGSSDQFAQGALATTPVSTIPAGAEAAMVGVDVAHTTSRPNSKVTGLVVLADGHIVTTADALADAASVTVTLADGTSMPAVVVGFDTSTDIGVLDIEGDAHPTIAIASPAELAESGSALVVERNATTPDLSVTSGDVAEITVPLEIAGGWTMHGMIASKVAQAPLSEASVLCAGSGSVVGLVTNRNRATATGDPVTAPPNSGTTRDAANTRTVFATPISYALHIAREIIATGTANHGWIGVLGIDRPFSDRSGSGAGASTGGSVITSVTDDSPAQRSGLQPGDIIVRVLDSPIESASSLVVALRELDPGDHAIVVYERDGVEQSADVTLADRPATVDAR